MIKATIVAVLVLANGTGFRMHMESQEACETFTRSIAQYVESADCETLTDYFPPME